MKINPNLGPKSLLFTLLLFLCPLLIMADVSIYDIQFTTVADDGTYPSLFDGQTVTTGGIVTATDYGNGRYFISSSAGGAWNGIFIYDNDHNPVLGDSIHIQGLVYEYYGITELKNLTSYETISSGNPIPAPVHISTHDLATEEAYESVLVEITDVGVTEAFDGYDEWRVNDGSGDCIISNGIYNFADENIELMTAYPFSSIIGVVFYSWGEFRLHPRGLADLQSQAGAFIVSAGSTTVSDVAEFQLPIQVALIGTTTEILSFNIALSYNPAVVQYTGLAQEGTLTENGLITDNSTPGSIDLVFSGQFGLPDMGTLLNLRFIPNATGVTPLNFTSASVNGNAVPYISDGEISILISNEPIGDTLTVIQRPLQNIPAIVTPGDILEVICLAPESTIEWSAELQYNSVSVALGLISVSYDTALNRWFLEFLIPEPDYFELYDLQVTASGLDDITQNSVQLIREIKTEYNFIHITDTHLATHYFYENPESVGDTSEMVDLREVINDINLINPEFVLLTGDLINEGELEDFETRRNFTKAQRLLAELEVPLYLVSGNHDLGGWDATPPPQGTSRWNWWRFFGWHWLSNPPEADLDYTQDYSFDYGSVHFIGMEAYINYDGYSWDIYGGESFIPTQLQWLNADLAAASASQTKVMFYHYDFSDDLDLSALGVDMALWGHTHQNSGDIMQHPYNLSTAAVCDDNRSYRVIRVADGNVQAEETVYATWPQSQSLSVAYDQANDGGADTVSAVIINNHDLEFEQARVKFNMPAGEHWYSVENGSLEQVIHLEAVDICTVSLDLAAHAQVTVTITADPDLVNVDPTLPKYWVLHQNYPNPFNPLTRIRFEMPLAAPVRVSIYNLNGGLVRVLMDGPLQAGQHSYSWDGLGIDGSVVDSGIYFYRVESGDFANTRKMTLLR